VREGLFVVDAHTHLFPTPTRYYRQAVQFTVDELIGSMGRYGVDFSVVVARPTSQLDIEALRAYHDTLAGDVARYPDRLAALCWGAPRLGQAGVDEVERCIAELGFRGLKLHPAQEQCNLDDADVYPLVEVARAHGTLVMAHTQLAVRGSEPWRLVPLAESFPETTFLMAHMGGDGGFQQGMQAAGIAQAVDNIVLETSTTVTDPYATFLGPAKMLGPERVVLGSDAPLHHVALNLLKLDLLEMDRDWRELLLGGTMQRLLGTRERVA
jgi:predicted TIM-barrel fold metal-dependent hydrolase